MIRLSICTRIKELQIHLHSMAQEEYRTQKSVRRKRPHQKNQTRSRRAIHVQTTKNISSPLLRSILESHNMVSRTSNIPKADQHASPPVCKTSVVQLAPPEVLGEVEAHQQRCVPLQNGRLLEWLACQVIVKPPKM